jgi:ankyrin repeat protein
MIMRKLFGKKADLLLYSPLLVALLGTAPIAVAQADASREQQQARAALEHHKWAFSEDRFVALSSTAKLDVIELYLQAGMSPDAKDAQGRPAIVAVLALGKLFSGDALGSTGHALLKERLAVLQYFLDSGADPKAADRSGITALHEAAMYPAFAPAIKPLVKAGSKVDAPETKYNFSPLHLAVLSKNAAGVRELLAAGANPDSLAKQSMTPLMFALNTGDDSIVQLLLRAGADPSKKTDGGKSCLHFAAETASASSIQLLIAKGATLTATDASQKTPLQVALEKNRDEAILSLLRP